MNNFPLQATRFSRDIALAKYDSMPYLNFLFSFSIPKSCQFYVKRRSQLKKKGRKRFCYSLVLCSCQQSAISQKYLQLHLQCSTQSKHFTIANFRLTFAPKSRSVLYICSVNLQTCFEQRKVYF